MALLKKFRFDNLVVKVNNEEEVSKSIFEDFKISLLKGQDNCDEMIESLSQIYENTPTSISKSYSIKPFVDILCCVNWKCIFTFNNSEECLELLLKIITELTGIRPNICEVLLKKVIISLFQGSECNSNNGLSEKDIRLFQQIHAFIRKSINGYPALQYTYFELLRFNFPYHQTTSIHSFSCYFYNLVESYSYLKSDKLIFFIVDKLIWLELASIKSEISLKESFQESKEDEDNHIRSIFDNCFELLLRYVYKNCFNVHTDIEISNSDQLANNLTDAFCNLLLRVDACIELPFIIPFLCSASEVICENVIDSFWSFAMENTDADMLVKRRAIFSIASLLQESKFISVNQVILFLEKWVNWAHIYINKKSKSPEEAKANFYKHGIFYAVFESVMYLIVCKHTEFDPKTVKLIRLFNFQKLVSSSLNPFAFCSSQVLNQFVEVARHHQIVLCSMVIERNKRLSLNTQCYISKNKDSYFPFKKLPKFMGHNNYHLEVNNDYSSNQQKSSNLFDYYTFINSNSKLYCNEQLV